MGPQRAGILSTLHHLGVRPTVPGGYGRDSITAKSLPCNNMQGTPSRARARSVKWSDLGARRGSAAPRSVDRRRLCGRVVVRVRVFNPFGWFYGRCVRDQTGLIRCHGQRDRRAHTARQHWDAATDHTTLYAARSRIHRRGHEGRALRYGVRHGDLRDIVWAEVENIDRVGASGMARRQQRDWFRSPDLQVVRM